MNIFVHKSLSNSPIFFLKICFDQLNHEIKGINILKTNYNTSKPFQKGYVFLFLFYLFLAVLGLRCCPQTFSSCGEQGLLFVVVRGLLIAVASLVEEHRL